VAPSTVRNILALRHRLDVTADIAGFTLNELHADPRREELAGRAQALSVTNELMRIQAAALEQRERLREAPASGDRAATNARQARVQQSGLLAAGAEPTIKEAARRNDDVRGAAQSLRPARPAPKTVSGAGWPRDRFHLYWFDHYGLTPPGPQEAIRYMGASDLQVRPYEARRWPSWEAYVTNVEQRLAWLDREGMKLLIANPGSVHPHPNYREASTCTEPSSASGSLVIQE
jgi:hypothetical protein